MSGRTKRPLFTSEMLTDGDFAIAERPLKYEGKTIRIRFRKPSTATARELSGYSDTHTRAEQTEAVLAILRDHIVDEENEPCLDEDTMDRMPLDFALAVVGLIMPSLGSGPGSAAKNA